MPTPEHLRESLARFVSSLGHPVADGTDLSGLVRVAAQLAREEAERRSHPHWAVRLARWVRQHSGR